MSGCTISPLRRLRPSTTFDKSIFWFRDDLHQPYVMSPMGMTTIQVHQSWGYHMAAETTQYPSSKGAHVKLYKGRVYLGFALIDEPAQVARRKPAFDRLINHCMEHWDDYYQRHMDEVIANLDSLNAVDIGKLTLSDLLEHLKRTEKINRRNWEIHFTLMYPANTVYTVAEGYVSGHGINEKAFVSMLQGFESMATRTDEEIWKLALSTEKLGLKALFLDTESENVLDELSKISEGQAWIKNFNRFLSVYGNRVAAGNLDVATPTWIEDPTPVIDTIKSFFPRIENGWDLYRVKADIRAKRAATIRTFEANLSGEEEVRKFRTILKAAQGAYRFQEDHGFYIDQGSTAALRKALIACGKQLNNRQLIECTEDVCFLTYSELREILEALTYHEKVAIYHYSALVPDLIRERKADHETAVGSEGPLTVGQVPETMKDPIGTKVFGIIDDILSPKDEDVATDRLEGFPGAPGIVEGPARVVLDYAEFQKVRANEILICPFTGTAHTPLFVKISGVVTDTGGMLTHAAIAAREYKIPAVVGTWNATYSISDGDIVRVNGNDGIVEILQKS